MTAMNATQAAPGAELSSDDGIRSIVAELETKGAVPLPPLVSNETLREMQLAFVSRLSHLRFNNVDGYHRTEPYRLMVEDALILSQGFIDIALHPIVTGVIERYVGTTYALCEAKGWQTQPTLTDFNSWHGDAWYDQDKITDRIPREVKLGFYLSNVSSGAFEYIAGSHRKQAPKALSKHEKQELRSEDILQFKGRAGTAVLFDTSGIHRQGVPISEPRRAVFYNYHDLDVPVQKDDLDYYRYHPLILNAAFLGGLTGEQYRVLGFGHKGRYQLGYVRPPRHPAFHRIAEAAHLLLIRTDNVLARSGSKLRRVLKPSRH
jgi:Phytanoyl-CoA dioxygenase (PhyH)